MSNQPIPTDIPDLRDVGFHPGNGRFGPEASIKMRCNKLDPRLMYINHKSKLTIKQMTDDVFVFVGLINCTTHSKLFMYSFSALSFPFVLSPFAYHQLSPDFCPCITSLHLTGQLVNHCISLEPADVVHYANCTSCQNNVPCSKLNFSKFLTFEDLKHMGQEGFTFLPFN